MSKPSAGPPQALIPRINYLQSLLQHLPQTLPLDPPESTCQFYIDEDRVADAGTVYPIVGRALELSFGTWKSRDAAVRFEERGLRVAALGPFLKEAVKRMTANERGTFEEAWIGRLVQAAKDSGASLPPRASRRRKNDSDHDEAPPPKKSCHELIVVLDSDDDMPAPSCLPTQTLAPSAIVPSTAEVDLTTNTQATLVKMGWHRWAPGAKEEHLKQANQLYHHGAEVRKLKKEKEDEQNRERRREVNAERQRRFRAKKKQEREVEEELSDDDNANIVLMRGADAAAHNHQANVAETSRAGAQAWRAGRNGTKGGTVQKKATAANWFHPFLWGPIEKQMRRSGWRPSLAVRKLQLESPLYKTLQKGTISRWRVRGKKEWLPVTLAKISAGKVITASGRTGILAPYPDITKNVKETLQGLRTAGAVVNVSIARGILIAEISQQQPQLLQKFNASEKFVRTFFASVMDWTPRKGTRQARHIPEDAPILLKRTFFRVRYAILTGKIPLELIVNADQAGNYLLPASGHTFHDRGAKQVDLVAKDEKRAYTMMIASTPAGDLLPIQGIWAGKTTGSLPNANAERYDDAMTRGFVFSSAQSKKKTSHFSTFASMKDWIINVIAPWRRQFLHSRPDLDDDQQMVLLLDIYPVHTGEEFRTWIFKEFPYIILLFIPGMEKM
ncbi:hypothetical protein C8R45DRAFT_917279 [Mycena sanguinolenta]|nr:hypothetical protein C8R45DRAFT_917279 [Mycena sanguinolenta]